MVATFSYSIFNTINDLLLTFPRVIEKIVTFVIKKVSYRVALPHLINIILAASYFPVRIPKEVTSIRIKGSESVSDNYKTVLV